MTSDFRPDPVAIDSQWVETADGLRMVSLGSTAKDDNGPRPWEISNLKAAVGSRALVATTSKYASRAPSLLKEAEKAGSTPTSSCSARASPTATASSWPARRSGRSGSGDLPKWSIGFATSVSDDRMEVVINLAEIQTDFIDEVLRHELGHVATWPATATGTRATSG